MAKRRRRKRFSGRTTRSRVVKGHTRGARGPKKGPRVRVKGYKRGRPDPNSYPR